MNKIEIVGVFGALKKLCEIKQYEKVEEVIDMVLNEAISKKGTKKKTKDEEEED